MSTSNTITKADLKAILDEIFPNDMVDYVVAEGTDNNWEYRKWKNGTFEAWRSYDASGLVMGTSSMGTYYNDTSGVKSFALPSFYVTITKIFAKEKPSLGSGVWIYVAVKDGDNLKVTYRSHASINNGVCNGDFYIKGTWK